MKKIAVLMENRFIEREILYYTRRFEEDGFIPIFLTRLWGQPALTFKGLELSMDFTVSDSFETVSQSELSEIGAVIVPAGYVADYLLYSEKPKELSPAVQFIEKLMKTPDITKAFICHSLWLAGPLPEIFKGRSVTCHNNIISHVENAGMNYTDKLLTVDGDLITARTGDCYPVLARTIIDRLKGKEALDIV